MEFCRLCEAPIKTIFLRKTLKLGWVAFHSVTYQLKCLDFQSNQYKKLVPVLSRFYNGLWEYWLKKYHKLQLFTFTNHTVVNRFEVYNFNYRVFCVCMSWIIQSFLRENIISQGVWAFLNYKDAWKVLCLLKVHNIA